MLKVIANGAVSSASGPEQYFTGTVRIDAPFSGTGSSNIGGATVTFEPGARTAWHTHPLGQTLIVTYGQGWIQCEGEKTVVINQGDVIFIPEGIKHWHGATPNHAMTHIAVAGSVNGNAVDWMEKVTDEQYI